MQEPARPTHCVASRITPAAQAWLSASSTSRPYHIFERVVNLINAEGDVLTLMLAPAQMNPLALEISCQDQSIDLTGLIQPTSSLSLSMGELAVGDVKISLERSTPWNPTPDWDLIRTQRDQLLEMQNVVLEQLLINPSPESLVVFASSGTLETPVLGWQERARKPVQELLHWLRAGDPARAGDCAASLAGLGVGLTPGGDDFIIGVMHAIWSILPDEQAMSIGRELSGAAGKRTNQLSACSLRRAAIGEISAAWQALLQGMAYGDQQIVLDQVGGLKQLGHTSGQDALMGFLLAFDALTD